MRFVHAMPRLVQLFQEAEDERRALAGACAWARRDAGADACAVVDSSGRLVAGDGLRPGESRAPAFVDRARTGLRQTANEAGGIVVVSPVRHGGATIGVIWVRGSEDATTLEQIASTLAALGASALRAWLDSIARTGDADRLIPELLGCSGAIAALRANVARAAVTPFAVVVEGESGTGKELVARAVHRLSARRDRRFSAVNCAAFSDELFEAELFGHARGAFTGALAPRAGLFEDAASGTLFLDEVSELSPRAQAKLLRALQEREIRRVGENTPRAIDVRVVAATNQPLSEAVARGRFREDLLFRLAVIRLHLPPLRDRIEDVPLLATAFWRQMSKLAGKHATLAPDAVAALCRHAWPGNVRELQNAVAGLAVVAPVRGRVQARHVHQVIAPVDTASLLEALPLEFARRRFERGAVAAALARHGGRRTAAARELGLSRQGLTKAIKRLGLSEGEVIAGVA
jgi:transcriptional regulator with PAS, ATPase and Fis domain